MPKSDSVGPVSVTARCFQAFGVQIEMSGDASFRVPFSRQKALEEEYHVPRHAFAASAALAGKVRNSNVLSRHSAFLSCGGETSHDSAAAGLRQSPRNTTAAVARGETPVVTPPSIIARHRTADDVDKIADNGGRHSGQTQRIEFGEAIQETMDDVVRYADVPHRIHDRRQHVCQSHYSNVILGTRFFVLRHAKAIAA